MESIYHRKRDFKVCNAVGVCATTKEGFVEEVYSMPTMPVSGTVDLIGVPAVINAKEKKEIMEMYEECSFAAIDGMPIVKIARKKGFKAERCAAPDIMPLVFKRSLKEGKSHFFYGGKNKEVLTRLKNNLEQEYPGIIIAGMFSPPFRPLNEEEDKQICSDINSLHPDFIWVGIGAPKQEKWMKDHRERIPGAVMIGVGAGFDFFAGTLSKAPKWIEKASLEWLYRLFKEPKRLWKRYIIGGFKWIFYNSIAR